MVVKLSAKGEKFGADSEQLQQIKRIFNDLYSDFNETGTLNAGVAESTLMYQELLDYFNANLKMEPIDLTYGDELGGSKRLFKALGKFFDKYFHPVAPVLPEHLVIGCGLSTVVDHLFEKICDPGDAVLIAAPYYNGFDGDLTWRDNLVPTAVEMDGYDPAGKEATDAYRKKIKEMRSKPDGPQPKAILLSSPQNPLGFVYSRECLIEYCKLAEECDVHLISDEIYALSIFASKDVPNPLPFTSILAIDVQKEAQCDPARVHCLYGMSKDFGANGLRIGLMVTQNNPTLHRACLSTSLLMKISSSADVLWSTLLNDEKMMTYYVEENQKRLSESYNLFTSYFRDNNISYRPCTAGLFIWIDLRPFLPSVNAKGETLEPKDAERELFLRMINGAKLFVAPGAQYHCHIPGFFRFTFALRPDYAQVALKRLGTVVEVLKEARAETA